MPSPCSTRWGAPATFVGYSMGGPIAQLIWRRHPDRVAGLVLCATAADFTMTPERWPIVWALDEVQPATRVSRGPPPAVADRCSAGSSPIPA